MHYYSPQFRTLDNLMYNLLISYYFSILFDVLHEKIWLMFDILIHNMSISSDQPSRIFHFRIDFKRASNMIKFCAGNCLSGLGLVIKEP